MTTHRTTARLVGALFLAAIATYGTGNSLVQAVTTASDYLSTLAENRAQLSFGTLLMLLNSGAVVGIGVLLFPVLKRQGERVALAYLATRLLEALLLTVGIVSLLCLIPIGQLYGDGPETARALGTLAQAGNVWSYQLAMLILGLGSLLFCAALYSARLVPRSMALWGMLGYAALLLGAVLEVFGVGMGLMLSMPGGLFELALPVWLFVRGFEG